MEAVSIGLVRVAAAVILLIKSILICRCGIANSGKPIVYYRLRMRDRDGKETVSKVVSLNLKGGADLLCSCWVTRTGRSETVLY
jgi:hypothetical protein